MANAIDADQNSEEKKNASKKHFSSDLEKRVFFGVLFWSVIMLVMVLMSFGVSNLIHTIVEFKQDADKQLDFLLTQMDRGALEEIFAETKTRYEEVEGTFTPEELQWKNHRPSRECIQYRSYFKSIRTKSFWELRNKIIDCKKSFKMDTMALFFYDEENNRVVYVIDGEEGIMFYYPGEYVEVVSKNNLKDKLDRIAKSDWKVNIEHAGYSGWEISDYNYLYDTNGNIIGYAGVDWDITDLVIRIFAEIGVALVLILTLSGFMIHFILRMLNRDIVRPILRMANATKTYSAIEAEELETAERIFEQIDPEGPDELKELLSAMCEMEDAVCDSMKKTRIVTAQRERAETELSVAHDLQMSLLPELTKTIEDDRRFDIFAMMRPAREVGGDFYDFFMIDDTHFAFLVADVSGKGAGAAMYMAVTRSMIRMRAMMGGTPGVVLSDVDHYLEDAGGEGLFVTVWMACLDITNGHLRFCNAGHGNPAICRRDEDGTAGSFSYEDAPHGIPLAAMPGYPMPEGECVLAPGEEVVVFTDGVTEAQTKEYEMFEKERVLTVLDEHKDESVEEIGIALRDAVDAFVGDVPQFDDMTILVLRYNGQEE